MKSFLRKSWKNVLMLLLAFCALIAFSAYHAHKLSDDYIRDSLPPPFYGIRFVLYPNNHIEGMPELGFKPGWIVTYAPSSKTYGTAFGVSLWGSMLGSGTPRIVIERLQQGRQEIEKFQEAFAKLDAAIRNGMPFSNAVAILGRPVAVSTNRDGNLDAWFVYEPRALEYSKIDWLTNGFSLRISNGIVFGKNYSFTSSH